MKIKKDLLVNILIFVCVLASMFFVPSLIAKVLYRFISNKYIVSLLAELIYVLLLFILFKKDLIKEAKEYKNNFSKCIKTGIKYYLIGIGVMIVSNLLIGVVLKGGISENETLVREVLFSYPIYFSIMTVIITGPICEELVFRKSLMSLSNNKYIYALLCGLFFGLAHVVTVAFTLFDLLYLIPYGALGFVFGCMNYETKSTFTSITMHCFHNLITFMLLLLVNNMGVI